MPRMPALGTARDRSRTIGWSGRYEKSTCSNAMPSYSGLSVPVSTTAGCSSSSANRRLAEAKVCVRFAGSALKARVGPNELAISTTATTAFGMEDGLPCDTRKATMTAPTVAAITSRPPIAVKRPVRRLRRERSDHRRRVLETMLPSRLLPCPNRMISSRPCISSSMTSSSCAEYLRIFGPSVRTLAAKRRGSNTPTIRCATTSSNANHGSRVKAATANTTVVTTAMTTGEIVCAKKISSNSTSVVISEIKSPLPLPASLAGASLRSAAKALDRNSASRRNATLWFIYCSAYRMIPRNTPHTTMQITAVRDDSPHTG